MTLIVTKHSNWMQGHILLRDTRRKHLVLIVSGSPPVTISIQSNFRMNLASFALPFSLSSALIKYILGFLVPCPLCHDSLAKPQYRLYQESIFSAPAHRRGNGAGESTQVSRQRCISQHRLRHSNKRPPDLRGLHSEGSFFTYREQVHCRWVCCRCLHSCIRVNGTASVWDTASLETERKEDTVKTPFLIKVSASKWHPSLPFTFRWSAQVLWPSPMSLGQGNRVLPQGGLADIFTK